MPDYTTQITVSTDEGEDEWGYDNQTEIAEAFSAMQDLYPNWTSMVITVVRSK